MSNLLEKIENLLKDKGILDVVEGNTLSGYSRRYCEIRSLRWEDADREEKRLLLSCIFVTRAVADFAYTLARSRVDPDQLDEHYTHILKGLANGSQGSLNRSDWISVLNLCHTTVQAHQAGEMDLLGMGWTPIWLVPIEQISRYETMVRVSAEWLIKILEL